MTEKLTSDTAIGLYDLFELRKQYTARKLTLGTKSTEKAIEDGEPSRDVTGDPDFREIEMVIKEIDDEINKIQQ